MPANPLTPQGRGHPLIVPAETSLGPDPVQLVRTMATTIRNPAPIEFGINTIPRQPGVRPRPEVPDSRKGTFSSICIDFQCAIRAGSSFLDRHELDADRRGHGQGLADLLEQADLWVDPENDGRVGIHIRRDQELAGRVDPEAAGVLSARGLEPDRGELARWSKGVCVGSKGSDPNGVNQNSLSSGHHGT